MAYRKNFAPRFLSFATVSSESSVPSVNNNPFFLKNKVPGLQTATAVPYSDRIPRVPNLMDGIRDSIRLEGSYPPKKEERAVCVEISVEETKKKAVLAWQVEEVRRKLRGMGRSYISYPELVRVCCDVTGRFQLRSEIPHLLENSGAVIVLGNLVFLQPDQVAKAIEGIIPVEEDVQRKRKELEAMEEKKVEIDAKAEAQVRRELWGGLGLISLQTAAFVRLTFWELSWDVMEPICFFFTSFYFMAGYAFFLRTSREPSFEGFFSSRFGRKQKSLMKTHNFDAGKLDELKRAYYGRPSDTPNSC